MPGSGAPMKIFLLAALALLGVRASVPLAAAGESPCDTVLYDRDSGVGIGPIPGIPEVQSFEVRQGCWGVAVLVPERIAHTSPCPVASTTDDGVHTVTPVGSRVLVNGVGVTLTCVVTVKVAEKMLLP